MGGMCCCGLDWHWRWAGGVRGVSAGCGVRSWGWCGWTIILLKSSWLTDEHCVTMWIEMYRFWLHGLLQMFSRCWFCLFFVSFISIYSKETMKLSLQNSHSLYFCQKRTNYRNRFTNLQTPSIFFCFSWKERGAGLHFTSFIWSQEKLKQNLMFLKTHGQDMQKKNFFRFFYFVNKHMTHHSRRRVGW